MSDQDSAQGSGDVASLEIDRAIMAVLGFTHHGDRWLDAEGVAYGSVQTHLVNDLWDDSYWHTILDDGLPRFSAYIQHALIALEMLSQKKHLAWQLLGGRSLHGVEQELRYTCVLDDHTYFGRYSYITTTPALAICRVILRMQNDREER
jgi:hypothetical protein